MCERRAAIVPTRERERQATVKGGVPAQMQKVVTSTNANGFYEYEREWFLRVRMRMVFTSTNANVFYEYENANVFYEYENANGFYEYERECFLRV